MCKGNIVQEKSAKGREYRFKEVPYCGKKRIVKVKYMEKGKNRRKTEWMERRDEIGREENKGKKYR